MSNVLVWYGYWSSIAKLVQNSTGYVFKVFLYMFAMWEISFVHCPLFSMVGLLIFISYKSGDIWNGGWSGGLNGDKLLFIAQSAIWKWKNLASWGIYRLYFTLIKARVQKKENNLMLRFLNWTGWKLPAFMKKNLIVNQDLYQTGTTRGLIDFHLKSFNYYLGHSWYYQ